MSMFEWVKQWKREQERQRWILKHLELCDGSPDVCFRLSEEMKGNG